MRKLVFTLCFGFLLFIPTVAVQADCGVCGDLTGDGFVDIDDIVAFVNWYYPTPPAMPETPECPLGGDVNCDSGVQSWELQYLFDYIFNGGPAPCDPEEWPACAE
ncbi:MAG: hypothetical protein R3F48_03860 [Candidatus Zixiibacteriota bacterium]